MQRNWIVVLAGLLLAACNLPVGTPPVESIEETGSVAENDAQAEQEQAAQAEQDAPPTETQAPAVDVTIPSMPLIQPDDLVYRGAFRLPDDAPDEVGWMWSGEALAYYPDGDPGGPDDGYPGSLFGAGHGWNTYISEINIPAPLISAGKNVDELPVASTLQPFQDIRGSLFDYYLEIPRVGLAYLPPQGEQSSGKLYFAWAAHLGETETRPSHGWSELDLSNPQTAGTWRIGEYWNYVTGDYLFDIPPDWADQYAAGMRLATGRSRDGGQGAMGPSLFAIAPWQAGNPPEAGSTLPAIPLLLYGSVYDDSPLTLNDYQHSDHWSGAAWLTAGEKSAVVFIGTKGTGDCWYGYADGTVWEEPYPEPEPEGERGWYSSGFEEQILFFDPADLAAVATGQLGSDEPQPYAVMNIDEQMFISANDKALLHGGSAAFDREHGLLYVLELFADGDKPLVHVWQVK